MMETERSSITEFIEEFKDKAIELSKTKLKDCPTKEDRHEQVEAMLDLYMEVTGKIPSSYVLTKLGDYLLIETLKDTDVDKVSNTEYPVLSFTQLKRRDSKQYSMQVDTLDFLHAKINKRMDSLAKRVTKEAEY